MPYSSPLFDEEIKKALLKIKPSSFLDIGPGAGKYGDMVKELFPHIHSIGVEIEKDYIEKFLLNKIYTEVWNIPASNLMQSSYLESKYDVVMLGDVLEHLRKSEGVDLLNFLIYRSKWIIIEFPHQYLQNAVNGYTSEAHISVWGKSDFENFESTPLLKKEGQRLIIVRGYLESETTVQSVTDLLSFS